MSSNNPYNDTTNLDSYSDGEYQSAINDFNHSVQLLGSSIENWQNKNRAEAFAREMQMSAQAFSQFQQSKADANNDIRSVADAMKQMGLDPLNAQFRGSSTGAAGVTTAPTYPSDHIPQMIALNEQHNKNKMDFLLGLKRFGVESKQVDAQIDELVKDSGRKDRHQANEDAMNLSQIDQMNKQQELEREKFESSKEQFEASLSEIKNDHDRNNANKLEELALKAQELQNQRWLARYNSLTGKEHMSIQNMYNENMFKLQKELTQELDKLDKEWQGDQKSKDRIIEGFKAVVQAIGIAGGLYLGRGRSVGSGFPSVSGPQWTSTPSGY